MLIQGKKLPLSLLKDHFDKTTSKGERLLQIESYNDTFGPKSKRKRPNLISENLEDMLMKVEENQLNYDETKDKDLHRGDIADMKD